MLRRLLYFACVVAALQTTLTRTAFAGEIKLDWSNGAWTYGAGGPFAATVISGPVGKYSAGQSFLTFCIEDGEFFSPGSTYYTRISDRAMSGVGGIDGLDANGNSHDLLSAQTAYLYKNFVNGTMTSVYASWQNTVTDLIDLQKAIWHFEGENVTGGTTYSNLLLAGNAHQNDGIGNVRVMQMWTNYNASTGAYSGFAQDQLVLIAPTPSAAAGGLVLLCLALTFSIVRRRQHASLGKLP